ncbi:MAG TPA: galactose-1-epimerase, partial [Phycisphaerae bacterium]|nr:galactose-1-epimerase [Phycisphaerae bacterium]
QLQYGGGYDLNFVLDQRDIQRQPAATLCDPTSGRRLELFATTPGLQFYSGNFLDSSHIGKGGHPYQRRAGLCLETQHYPDSPNHAHFPSTVLRPGQQYRHTAVYRFSTR